MSSLIHRLDAASLLNWLSHCEMRGAAVLLIAMVITLAMRRASAAAKYLALLLGTAALLLLPAMSVLLPGWHVLPNVSPPRKVARVETVSPSALLPSILSAPSDQPFIPAYAAPSVATVMAPTLPKLSPTVTPPPVKAEPISWQWWMLLGWLAGCGTYLTYLAAAYFSLGLLGHRSTSIADRDWAQLLDEAKQRLNFHRPIRLIQSARRSMPMTWGIWRTSILLPADASDWPTSQRRAVLLHELAHARRWDCLTQLLVQLACTLHWFNPLIWLTWKWMQIEREKACDDLVLTAGAKASTYAEQLLQIASQHRGGGIAAIAMARRSSMERRLLAILDTKRNRRAITWSAAAIALVLMASIAAPLAMLRAQEASHQPTGTNNPAATQPFTEVTKRQRAIELENAQQRLADVEKKYKVGIASRVELDAADWDVKIAKARQSPDPLDEALQRWLAANANLKTTDQMYQAGLATESQLREARGNAKLMQNLLDEEPKDPASVVAWQNARQVKQIIGSSIVLSNHGGLVRLQQGDSAIEADRIILRTVAGDVCLAYVPFDYAGYNGLQLSNVNTGQAFEADHIELNAVGELIVDHKVATTQMALGSGPPTTATVQPIGSVLSFCIAASADANISKPHRNLLPDVLARQYIADLEQNGPQRVAGFIWCEAASDEQMVTVVNGTHAGKRYVLLSQDPYQSMLTDRTAPRTWGLNQVKAGADSQGNPILNFTLDSAGTKLFGRLTESNLHQPLAMVIDDKVVMVATIQSKIGHEGIISFEKNVTPEMVRKLAGDLKNGMPAVPAITPPTTQAELPAIDREFLYQQIAAVDKVMPQYLRQRENDQLVIEELKSRGIGSNNPIMLSARANIAAAQQRVADYAREYLATHPGFPNVHAAAKAVTEAFVMGSVKHAGPTTLPTEGVITLKQLVDTAEPDSPDAEVALHRNGVVTKYRLKDIRELAADNPAAQPGDVLMVSDSTIPASQPSTANVSDVVGKAVNAISTCAEGDPRLTKAMDSLKGLVEPKVVATTAKYLTSDEDTVRRAAIYVLWRGGFKSIDAAVDPLKIACKNKEDLTRGMAALALGQNKAADCRQMLIYMAEKDQGAYARRCGAYALGLLGDTGAIPELQKIALDPDAGVANNAKAAIKMLTDLKH